MDACMSCILEANQYINQIKDISYFQEVFEDVDDEAASNDENTKKSLNLLEKSINFIKGIIKRIREIIDTIVEWMKMDKTEKSKYKDFVERCKNNPEFANKKVTIHDYREIQKKYDEELERQSSMARAMKEEELANKPSIIKDASDKIDELKDELLSVGKSYGKTVTIKVALEYAKTSQAAAIRVRNLLKADEIFLNQLQNEMSAPRRIWTRIKLRGLSSRIGWIRKIFGARQDEVKTLSDCVKEVMGVCGSDGDLKDASDEELGEIAKDQAKKKRGKFFRAQADIIMSNKNLRHAAAKTAKVAADAGVDVAGMEAESRLRAAGETHANKAAYKQAKRADAKDKREMDKLKAKASD